MAQRAGDYCTIPLCYECHQGKNGIHGDRALWKVYKKTELDVLDETIESLVCDVKRAVALPRQIAELPVMGKIGFPAEQKKPNKKAAAKKVAKKAMAKKASKKKC